VENYKVIAEIIGFIASFILLYSATRVKDRDLIIMQGVSNSLWIIHYIMFGAITGVIACTFGVLRNAFVFKWNSYRAKMGFVFIFFLFCIFQLFFINHYIEGIPIIAIFIISYGVLFAEKNKLTLYLLVGNLIFLVFSIYIDSISATFNYIAMLTLLLQRAYKIKNTKEQLYI
jgi:hypothetical protein